MASEMELSKDGLEAFRVWYRGHTGKMLTRSNAEKAIASYFVPPNTRPVPAPVGVKELEWHVPTDHPSEMEDTAILIADGLGGKYAISRPQKVGPKFLLWWAHDAFDWTGFDTPEAAKAAAQADYEQCILSALTSPQTSEAGE